MSFTAMPSRYSVMVVVVFRSTAIYTKLYLEEEEEKIQ